jgi:aminoglycoside phosphotransferase (APT) family kinase protein
VRTPETAPRTLNRIADPGQLATDLAQFVAALQRIDPEGGPSPRAQNFGRGVPLALRDTLTPTAIASLRGTIDADAVTAAWKADLHDPA